MNAGSSPKEMGSPLPRTAAGRLPDRERTRHPHLRRGRRPPGAARLVRRDDPRLPRRRVRRPLRPDAGDLACRPADVHRGVLPHQGPRRAGTARGGAGRHLRHPRPHGEHRPRPPRADPVHHRRHRAHDRAPARPPAPTDGGRPHRREGPWSHPGRAYGVRGRHLRPVRVRRVDPLAPGRARHRRPVRSPAPGRRPRRAGALAGGRRGAQGDLRRVPPHTGARTTGCRSTSRC